MTLRGREVLALAALLLVAAAVRLAALDAAEPLRAQFDERYYVEVADNLARGRGHVYVGGMEGEARAWRPPGHAWLLSLVVDESQTVSASPADDPDVVRPMARLETGLGILLVLLTVLLGRALFDARVGWVAGALAALHPALVAHSHYLWSETFFGVLITAGLLLVAWASRPCWPLTLAAGAVFGAATLTREVAGVIAALSGLWWVWLAKPEERRDRWIQSLALVGICIVIVLPWTLRNHRVLGAWIPVSNIGWFALAEGNSLESPSWMSRSGPERRKFHAIWFSERDELARLDLARRHALERIRAEQPAWLGKKLLRNLGLLLNPDSVLRYKLRHGAYGDRPPGFIRLLLASSIPFYLLVTSFGILGIAAAADRGRRRLALLVFGAVIALHVLANATPRFRVPWTPLLLTYTGFALVHWRSLPRRLAGSAGVAAALALMVLLAVGLPYYLTFGPRP